MASRTPQQRPQWDVFCRVIDNFGDLGVCWRLTLDLAQRGHTVRLWVDDAGLAQRMTHPTEGVEVRAWTDAESPAVVPAWVVVEAFGCELPAAFLLAMRQCAQAPVWINLEYLSAEAYVERSHGLPSPQMHGPAAGLSKWFFYPGFTEGTGGLLREADLPQRLADHDRTRHRAQLGVPAGAFCVSVFCYPHAPLEGLLDRWLATPGPSGADAPLHLLVTAGPWAERLRRWCPDKTTHHREVRWVELPWMRQDDYDRLLWSCDLNLVRGEDSAVRALWAGIPSLWQLYRQDDGAHEPKLEAFLQWSGAPPEWQSCWRALNGMEPWPQPWPWQHWPTFQDWAASLQQRLLSVDSLGERLIAFVRDRMKG